MSEEEIGSSFKDLERVPLSFGLEKSNIRFGVYEISDGSYHPEPPPGLEHAPGLNHPERNWYSGEALIFSGKKGFTIMAGRDADLKIDADLVDFEEFITKYKKTEPEMVKAVDDLGEETSVDEEVEEITQLPDIGDPKISRDHLQISYHPNGSCVVAYSGEFGRLREYNEGVGARSPHFNYPDIIANYKKELVTHKIRWIEEFGGSVMPHDQDIIVLRGEKRTICLRYFAAKKDKPAILIKQSYPPEISLEDLHKQLVVKDI